MAILTATPSTTLASERDCWRTPPEVFGQLDNLYGPFDLDAAADAHNHLCDMWLGPGSTLDDGTDALRCEWRTFDHYVTRAFCNPPYSLARQFVEKAHQQARLGIARTTLLLPATTDVKWWQQYVWDGSARRFHWGVEVDFLRRIKFLRPDGSPGGSPNFGSVVVTFWA